MRHDKHFYVEALVLLQDHKLNYLWLRYLQSKLFRDTTIVDYTTGDGEVHEQTGEAQLPKSNKPPQLPTEEERSPHELTHQPYRAWCEICQRSKGRPAYHKRLPRDKESVIQMDYDFLQDPHLPHATTIRNSHNARDYDGLANAILTTTNDTLLTNDNRSKNGLLQMVSPTACYKPIQSQQYYN